MDLYVENNRVTQQGIEVFLRIFEYTLHCTFFLVRNIFLENEPEKPQNLKKVLRKLPASDFSATKVAEKVNVKIVSLKSMTYLLLFLIATLFYMPMIVNLVAF